MSAMEEVGVDINAALEIFNTAFGVYEYSYSQHVPSNIVTLRNNLLEEEMKELFVAFKKLDILDLQPEDDALAEVADALGDIIYIAAGTMRVYYSITSETNVVLRNEGQFPPRADKAVEEVFTLVTELFGKKFGETSSFSPVSIYTCFNLRNIIHQCLHIAFLLCIPIASVFAEIHRSNMAKIQPDGTIKRRKDGKILKPESWTPPELSPLLLAWYNQLYDEHEADKADA